MAASGGKEIPVGDTGSRMTIPPPSPSPEPVKRRISEQRHQSTSSPTGHRLSHDKPTQLEPHRESKSKRLSQFMKKTAKGVGQFLGFNETEEHMQLWKDRMTEMAKTDHIGLHMSDVNMKKEHPQADVVYTLKKALEEVADDPEEERHILESDLPDQTMDSKELRHMMRRGTAEKDGTKRDSKDQSRMTVQFSRALIHDMTVNMERESVSGPGRPSQALPNTSATREDKVAKARHLPGVEAHHTNMEMFGGHHKSGNLLDELRTNLQKEKVADDLKGGHGIRKPKGDEVEINLLHRMSLGGRPTVSYEMERDRLQQLYAKGLQEKKEAEAAEKGNKCLAFLEPCFGTCMKKETPVTEMAPTPTPMPMGEASSVNTEEVSTTDISSNVEKEARPKIKLRSERQRLSEFDNVDTEGLAKLEALYEEKERKALEEDEALTEEEMELRLKNDTLNSKGLKPLPPGADPKDYAYRKEALDHYKEFIEMEENEKRQAFEERKQQMIEKLLRKQEIIAQALEIGKEFYCQGKVSKHVQARHPHGSQESIESHHHHIRHIRKQLEDLNVFRPWFIGIITVLQFIVVLIVSIAVGGRTTIFLDHTPISDCLQFIVLIVSISVGGLTTISLDPVLEIKDDITFDGATAVHHWFVPNMWIGPSMDKLISMGAVHGFCMRKDVHLLEVESKSTDLKLGCCESSSSNVAGTATQEECEQLSSGRFEWNQKYICRKRPSNMAHVMHNLKPCCYFTQKLCKMTSEPHCKYLGGTWHTDKDHCSEVNCLKDICYLGFGAASDSLHTLYQDENHILNNQWFRFPFSLLLHYGIIHYAIVAVIQVVLGVQIEKLAGWLRIGLIYIISGLMALVAAGLFGDKHPQCGAMGSVFGLLGVQSVEFMQSWKIIAKPWIEVVKFVGIFALLIVFGTFSFNENMGNIMGYLFGIITGILFLPFITFGKWDSHRKRILILATWPIALTGVFILYLCFYWVQHLNCDTCYVFSCIPYTERTCQSYTDAYLKQEDN